MRVENISNEEIVVGLAMSEVGLLLNALDNELGFQRRGRTLPRDLVDDYMKVRKELLSAYDRMDESDS